jgi:hypothetical protein
MAKIDRGGEAKTTADAKRLRQQDDQVKENTSTEKRSALFEWEDDGGAQQSDADGQTDTARPSSGERRRRDQQGLDATHDSDLRGEHRYDDTHQTEAEQKTRQERDDLKQRLAGRVTRRTT